MKYISKSERLQKKQNAIEYVQKVVSEMSKDNLHFLKKQKIDEWLSDGKQYIVLLVVEDKALQEYTILEMLDKCSLKTAVYYTKLLHLSIESIFNVFNMAKLNNGHYLNAVLLKSNEDTKNCMYNAIVKLLNGGKFTTLQEVVQNNDKWKIIVLEYILQFGGSGKSVMNQYANGIKNCTLKNNVRLGNYNTSGDRGFMLIQLRAAVHLVLPNARVEMFGSSMTGLCSKKDDVDVHIGMEDSEVDSVALFQKLKVVLEKYDRYVQVEFVPKARVPILKCVDAKTKLPIDISMQNVESVLNSKIIEVLVKQIPKFKVLAMVLRDWGKHRLIHSMKKNQSRKTYIVSSYGMVLLLLYYIQVIQLVPKIPNLPDVAFEGKIAFMESDFAHQVAQVSWEHVDVAQVLFDFFKYYAATFNYATDIVALRRDSMHMKRGQHAPLQLKTTRHANVIVIQDIFNPTHDVCHSISIAQQHTFRAELLRAVLLLSRESSIPNSSEIMNILLRPHVSTWNSGRHMLGDDISTILFPNCIQNVQTIHISTIVEFDTIQQKWPNGTILGIQLIVSPTISKYKQEYTITKLHIATKQQILIIDASLLSTILYPLLINTKYILAIQDPKLLLLLAYKSWPYPHQVPKLFDIQSAFYSIWLQEDGIKVLSAVERNPDKSQTKNTVDRYYRSATIDHILSHYLSIFPTSPLQSALYLPYLYERMQHQLDNHPASSTLYSNIQNQYHANFSTPRPLGCSEMYQVGTSLSGYVLDFDRSFGYNVLISLEPIRFARLPNSERTPSEYIPVTIESMEAGKAIQIIVRA